jgi:hypothetical protein
MVVTIAGHCRSPVVVWQVVKLVSFCFEKNLVTTGLTWHPSCTILEYPERILQTINVPLHPNFRFEFLELPEARALHYRLNCTTLLISKWSSLYLYLVKSGHGSLRVISYAVGDGDGGSVRHSMVEYVEFRRATLSAASTVGMRKKFLLIVSFAD